MCGIFLTTVSGLKVSKGLGHKRLSHRGPDETIVRKFQSRHINVSERRDILLAFHRLAIMGISASGMQPFSHNNMLLIANGEIYNHVELRRLIGYKSVSGSDCEVILPLFEKFGKDPVRLCRALDGEFAFIIYDQSTDLIYVGVDELSVRPLFYCCHPGKGITFASELKSVITPGAGRNCHRFPPGCCATLDACDDNVKPIQHFDWDLQIIPSVIRTYEDTRSLLYSAFCDSVRQKISADRGVAAFLSGGLDSSLVCGEITKQLREVNPNAKLLTATIGLVPSEQLTVDEKGYAIIRPDMPLPSDIVAARKVSQAIGSLHEELWFSFDEAYEQIQDTIMFAETWDQTTIRASVPMRLGALELKRRHPKVAVIFSGEISDELLQGYLYNHKCPDPQQGREDTIRLLKEVHLYDGLRFDRMVASASCEGRLPFFNRSLIRIRLESDPSYFMPSYSIATQKKAIEKFILRDGADHDPACLVPKEIIWRTKEALSDATSHCSSWKTFIQDKLSKQSHENELSLYKMFFEQEFPGCYDIIPHLWMPQWSPGVTDPSATTLPDYNNLLLKQ